MSLIEQIRADWKAARIAREAPKATLLGTLVGAIQSKEKTFSPERPLTDEEIVAQVKKMLDGVQETIGHLQAHAGSADAIEKAQAEVTWLTVYMPQQMDEAAVEAFLRSKQIEGIANMGGLMAALKAAHAGAYDGKLASAVAKRVLA
jgi:uncharacterized protein YqeY